MNQTDRPLDNPINWSFRLGRVFHVDVHVHVVFILCAVALLALEIPQAGEIDARSTGRMLTDACGMLILLFGLVLLHELCHCFMARRTGGTAQEILLWPFGGLAPVAPANHPPSVLMTAFAGPLCHILVCAACSVILTLWSGRLGAVPWNPVHPITPFDGIPPQHEGQQWIIRAFGVSYVLLLLNLLPVHPFDGGRILQAWLWPKHGYRESMEFSCAVGMIAAIFVGLFGLFIEESWLLLVVAVFGYLTCWQGRRADQMNVSEEGGANYLGYDGGAVATRAGGDWTISAGDENQESQYDLQRADRERKREEAREIAVDEILRKVFEDGISSLTWRESWILRQETKRRRAAEQESLRNVDDDE